MREEENNQSSQNSKVKRFFQKALGVSGNLYRMCSPYFNRGSLVSK